MVFSNKPYCAVPGKRIVAVDKPDVVNVFAAQTVDALVEKHEAGRLAGALAHGAARKRRKRPALDERGKELRAHQHLEEALRGLVLPVAEACGEQRCVKEREFVRFATPDRGLVENFFLQISHTTVKMLGYLKMHRTKKIWR